MDFYGTLAKAEATRPSLGAVCRELGLPITEEEANRWSMEAADGIVHPGASRSPEHFRRWELSRYRRLLRACAIDEPAMALLIEASVARARRDSIIRPVSGAARCLQELRRVGLDVVVCSNWGWDLPQLIEQVGLSPWVRGVICSAEAGGRKPHPRPFAAALRLARGCDPSNAMMVGDHPIADGVGGVSFGLRAVSLVVGSEPLPAVALLAQTLKSLQLAADLEEAVEQVIHAFIS